MKARAKKQLLPQPCIVIQVILTQWSKASRGGERAGVRNQVPEALALPALKQPLVAPSSVIHGANYTIDQVLHPGGAPSNAVQPMDMPVECDCVRVRFQDEVAHVDFRWNGKGMPERPARSDALILQPGQWGRVRYNARRSPQFTPHSWDWPWWWYEKWCMNIGYFADFSPRVFLDTKPLLIYSQMADLW